jgi:hypothetical protein
MKGNRGGLGLRGDGNEQTRYMECPQEPGAFSRDTMVHGGVPFACHIITGGTCYVYTAGY